jgi:ribonuclease HI
MRGGKIADKVKNMQTDILDFFGAFAPLAPPAPASATATAATAATAVPAAAETAETRTAPKVVLFTDGGCLNNGQRHARASMGVVVWAPTDQRRALSFGAPLDASEPQTNQRAELRALHDGIQLAVNQGLVTRSTPCDVYTDSTYSINCTTVWCKQWKRNGWTRAGRPIEHLPLIRSIVELLAAYPQVRLHHVRGHQDARRNQFPWCGNYLADKLAGAALTQRRRVTCADADC